MSRPAILVLSLAAASASAEIPAVTIGKDKDGGDVVLPLVVTLENEDPKIPAGKEGKETKVGRGSGCLPSCQTVVSSGE